MDSLGRMLLAAYRLAYEQAARPLVFRGSAQDAHTAVMRALRWADGQPWLLSMMQQVRPVMWPEQPVAVGGARLPVPLMVAAGFVKGDGFASEDAALAAVEAGRNIMPGWASMPRLAGPVEFGSFTRWPRLGNPGVAMWRDAPNRSTQNRVGLKNPGARAAARFLSLRQAFLPPVYGINIAVSPGVDDPDQEQADVLAAAAAFIEAGLRPAWLTLNLSCPNTEDDPGGNQTADKTRRLCGALADYLQPVDVPLWVKVGPDLAAAQYTILMRVFADLGARAVIATNTLSQPSPADAAVMAGVGGARLHWQAVAAAACLQQEKQRRGYPVDVIGCGGVSDGHSYRAYTALNVSAVQYWSALVFRGPLAGALIAAEAHAAE